MQRRAIGIDLSPDYCKMAERRLQQTALELTSAQEGA
jgi:DNA modification methylase